MNKSDLVLFYIVRNDSPKLSRDISKLNTVLCAGSVTPFVAICVQLLIISCGLGLGDRVLHGVLTQNKNKIWGGKKMGILKESPNMSRRSSDFFL